MAEEGPFQNGVGKNRWPDLKQFMMTMLCAGRSIPIMGGCADGNASDKVLNADVLTRISAYMARHGWGEERFCTWRIRPW